MQTFLCIYISGVVVAIAILAYVYYRGWYNGEPITLGNVVEFILVPLFSWAAVIATAVSYVYDNSDKVVFKGRKKGGKTMTSDTNYWWPKTAC